MKKFLYKNCIVIFIILVACTTGPRPTQSGTVFPIDTSRDVTPSHTPIFFPSPTMDLSTTPTMTETSTRTPTETLVLITTEAPTNTWTPRPTLPPDEAKAMALKMILTNGNCLFPCWMGITPGKTTWDEAYAFLATFADHFYYTGGNSYGVFFKLPKDAPPLYSGAAISVRNGIVESISTAVNLKLSDLLTSYGMPSEVKIWAIGFDTMDPVGSFTLVLFYPDKGILATYTGQNELGQTIHICPSHITGRLSWFFWDPDQHLTYSEIGRQLLLFNDPFPPHEKDYVDLPQAAGMSLETFYQQYQHPENNEKCFAMTAPDYPTATP